MIYDKKTCLILIEHPTEDSLIHLDLDKVIVSLCCLSTEKLWNGI